MDCSGLLKTGVVLLQKVLLFLLRYIDQLHIIPDLRVLDLWNFVSDSVIRLN